jgi:5-methylcytosine-specific restriction endonuclease McrA
MVRRIALRDGWACWWCDLDLDISTATLDHLVAVAYGGSNRQDNQVLACEPCNNRRGSQPWGDFAALLPPVCMHCGMWHLGERVECA